jgi:transcriptional regulator with XRE-family HTH domain
MVKSDKVVRQFGLAVKRHREARRLTQEAFAEKAELDRTYLSDIERGLRNPGIKNIAKIANALDMTVSELCRGIDS